MKYHKMLKWNTTKCWNKTPQNIEINTKPSLLLEGEKPRLIDEWQLVPKLWNAVRYSVDKTGKQGQYILTGSATPKEDDTLHSGVGRFAFVTMKPMTLFESGDSNGKISLTEILNGNRDIDGIKTDLTYEEIAYVLCRGGWPTAINMPKEKSLQIAKNYIDVLKKIFIIEEIPAWKPNIRSKTAIRTANKKSMIDPSLAVAALGCSYKELMLDIRTYGLLFENLVNRDLSVYVNSIDGTLKHYRDRYNLECDNVIHFKDGRYALVETKLGGTRIKEAEEHLLELRRLIIENEPKIGEPEFMMVITGTDMAYTTENGILVVPIGTLRN